MQLSNSVEKHSNSLIAAAKIAAAEQAKNRTQSRVSEIHSRINALRDSKRDMAICMTAPNIQIDAICFEMTKPDGCLRDGGRLRGLAVAARGLRGGVLGIPLPDMQLKYY